MGSVAVGVGVFVVFLGMVAVFAAVLAFPTMWLWNWLMPDLFALKTIDPWQALGLNILTGILFKSSSSSSKQGS